MMFKFEIIIINLIYFIFFCSKTYKLSKDGSTLTLLKHLNNKHPSVRENKQKAIRAMDKFVTKTDELACILYYLIDLIFIFNFYLLNINFKLYLILVLTEIYTRKLAK